MRNVKVLVPIILVLVGLGVGFFGGFEYRNYQIRKNLTNGGENFQRFVGNRNGTMGGQGNVMMRGGVFGTIFSIDSNGITVKLNDGSSKIVLFSSSTTFANTVSATKNDLKTGDTIAVFGASNSDGSVTATSVQINPEFGRPQPSLNPSK